MFTVAFEVYTAPPFSFATLFVNVVLNMSSDPPKLSIAPPNSAEFLSNNVFRISTNPPLASPPSP